uniref:Uncharacterized protein n=1 Tax=Panagrolaimus sp. ES5 TaxID=591445 RepID=A0AC34FGQ1_9BILA
MKLTDEELGKMNSILESITAGANTELTANEAADF